MLTWFLNVKMIYVIEKWFFVEILWFGFTHIPTVLAARHCCPENTYIVEGSNICSDEKTSYSLKCEEGAFLLDPNVNKQDDFTLQMNGTLLILDGEETPHDKFCTGKIKHNTSEISSKLVALVCFQNEADAQKDATSIIFRVLMVFSTFFLLITLYIYVRIPNLRDLQGKCLIAIICCLVASYTTLFMVQTFPNYSEGVCVMQAALLYFFMSACFFWNNIIAFFMWKSIRNITFKINEKLWCIIFLCWGFGVPFLMVLVSFILEHVPEGNHVRPHFAETKCWFGGNLETWSYFYGPVSVILVLNTLMFIQSSWTLWKNYKNSSVSKIRSLRFKFLMYLKLFLLMGITWIFEVVSYAAGDSNSITKYLWFVTDCLNSAQGVFIFLILVVFRQKAKLGLLRNKLFGINWPESWAKEELEESSAVSSVEEVELANQKIKMLNES